MKQVIIVVPNGYANLSSITGSFEILTRANAYWQKMGNKPMLEVRIAGFVTELKLGTGFFSVYPADIKEIKKTDLVIIPSLSYDFAEVIKEN
ncbi:MAG: AraC family transcriptional regulator, partial [Bacteroidota bacterium]